MEYIPKKYLIRFRGNPDKTAKKLCPSPAIRGSATPHKTNAGTLVRLHEKSGSVLRNAAHILAICGAAVMLLLLAIICANIFLRPFGGSIRGTVEISGYLCALAVGLAMPAAQLKGSHINAGLRASSLPKKLLLLQDMFCSLLACLLLGLAGKELLAIAEYAADMGEYIEGFTISSFGMAVGLAAGLLLQALLFAHRALGLFLSAKPKETAV